MIRSRRALGLALFFGIQSMQAYVTFGWLGGLAIARPGYVDDDLAVR